MAIDMHKAMPVSRKAFLTVHSQTVGGCRLGANHVVPGGKTPDALLRHGYLRPLDVLVDVSFNGNSAALSALDQSAAPGFSPVTVDRDPQPARPESDFVFKWSTRMNPRWR
jgi:hypothetical protein